MSLPLTRRIARAALLVGAAAAPLIGAGAASAAELPQTGDLSGLTNVDKAPDFAGTVTGVSKETGAVKTAQESVPTTARTLPEVGRTAEPTVKDAATKAAGTVGGAARAADDSGLPLRGLRPVSALPSADQLPLKGLPIGG